MIHLLYQKKGVFIMKDTVFYKGYAIEYNFYGQGEYTVFYCGDDIVFHSVKDAKNFIDSLDN